MTEEIKRETVSIGIDFRPIPIDIGDGTIWLFDPDPDPAKFNALVRALRRVGQSGKEVDEGDDSGFGDALTGFSDALQDLLAEKDQRASWKKKNYGLGAMSGLSRALVQQITGFTQE